MEISENEEQLKTIETKIAEKLRKAQPQPKVTGSYKTKSVSSTHFW